MAKGLLEAQAHLLPDDWSLLAAWVLPLGSMGTTLLMARFLYLASREKIPGESAKPVSWWLLLAGVLLLPWIWPLELERSSPLWGALWPVLLAAGPAWIVYQRGSGQFLRAIPAIPPGDILVLAEKLLQRIPRYHPDHSAHRREHDAVLQPRAIPAPIAAPERMMGKWQVAVALLLLLVTGLLLILAATPP